MPYVIVTKRSGVYAVEPVGSVDTAVALLPVVVRDGRILHFAYSDLADKKCRELNKERAARIRATKASQQKLFEEAI